MDAPMLLLLLMFGAGLLITALAVKFLLLFKVLLNSRPADLHHEPGNYTPRLGGMALVLAYLALLALSPFIPALTRSSQLLAIAAASIGMFVLGIVDDFRPIQASTKLLVQVCIAVVVWSSGVGIFKVSLPFIAVSQLPTWLTLVLTVIWIVGVTNVINLIDGLDGLAGGICLASFAFIFFTGGTHAGVACGMMGAILAFLRFNFAPARIYLGDGGAYFLGAQIALVTLVNSRNGENTEMLIISLSLLAVPILDAHLAVLRRCLRGLPIFQADRGHIHHRLLELGLSHRRVLLILYALTAVSFGVGNLLLSELVIARWLGALIALTMVLLLSRISLGPVRVWPKATETQPSLREEDVTSAL